MAAAAFGFDDVERRARELAAASYTRPASNLPPELQAIGYDQYRDIRFKPDRALWRDAKLPFEVMFFHQGWFYEHAGAVHEVAGEQVRDDRLRRAHFDYGQNKLDAAEAERPGLRRLSRALSRCTRRRYKDEVVVFLGASYFRALGRTSATACRRAGSRSTPPAPRGEEFPRFTDSGSSGRRPGATA